MDRIGSKETNHAFQPVVSLPGFEVNPAIFGPAAERGCRQQPGVSLQGPLLIEEDLGGRASMIVPLHKCQSLDSGDVIGLLFPAICIFVSIVCI